MENLIKQYCQEKNIPAISVCIHENGQKVFSYTEGKISQRSTQTVDEHTRFTIGSISKLFVTVAVLQICEQNLISLDNPVYLYLPDFIMNDSRYQKITIRMLLNHSSGLPSTTFKGKYTNHYYPQYIQDMLHFYQKEPLKSEPGKYSVYCNDGFVLAQYLVETLSQMSFRDYCLTYITKVALMKDTEFPGYVLDDNTYAHAPNDYQYEFNQEFVNGIGSGGVYSTSHDLCLFLDALIKGKLINQSSFEEMTKNQFYTHIKGITLNANGYGLGFDHVHLPYFNDLQAMGKGGATFGYLSYAYVIPSRRLSVSILSTSKEAGVTPLAKKLGQLYLSLKQTPLTLEIPSQEKEIDGIYGADNRVYQIKQYPEYLSLSYYQLGKLSEPIYIHKLGEEYYFNGLLLGFDHPHFGFYTEEGITYMYVTYADEEVQIRSIIGQKIERNIGRQMSIPGKYYLKLNEYKEQRTFYTQDLQVIAPVVLKDKGCILAPFPLKIIAENHAVPFVEMPGNYAREMCELHILPNDILQLGPYRYINMDNLQLLNTSFKLINEDTQWYIYQKDKVISKPKEVRMIGIKIKNNQAIVCFDSLYCHEIDNSIEYIGFMGMGGEHIEIR